MTSSSPVEEPFVTGASPPPVRTLLFIFSSRFTHVFIIDITAFLICPNMDTICMQVGHGTYTSE